MGQENRREFDSTSLSDERRAARTMGCVGLSIVAHFGFLAAMSMVPERIQDLGGNAGKSGSSSVEMMEVADAEAKKALAADKMVEVSVAQQVTDPSSDIVQPAPKPEIMPTIKPAIKPTIQPAAKAQKPTAPKTIVSKPSVAPSVAPSEKSDAKPIETEESADAPPVLLANPPEASEGSDAQELAKQEQAKEDEVAKPAEQEPQEVPAPLAVATKTEEKPVEKVENTKPVSTSESTQDTAAAGSASRTDETASSQTSNAVVGDGGAGQGAGESKGQVIGPIRDVSQLRALPGNPMPVYPARDRLAKKEGTSVLLGRIGADGRVSEVVLEKGSGSKMMDASSMQAFRSWRFQQGQQGWVRNPFQFRLVGEAKEIPAPLGKQLKR